MMKPIRVGFDGSAEATEAVRWAADEAVARTDQLQIVSCFAVPVIGDAMTGWVTTAAHDLMREATERAVRDLADGLTKSHPTLDFTTDVGPETPALALLQHSERLELIVVGSSTHHGAAAFWLGSTPRHVTRRAKCPVAVVRGAVSRGRPDRIVVGVDGSPGAAIALDWAVEEANLHGVPLVVVHAWDYAYPYSVLGVGADTQGSDLTRVDAACVLNRMVESARDRCRNTVIDVLVEGAAVPALLRSVCDGDVLVLGSRGRGALTSGVFGSTVNAVLDAAMVPVVVVGERSDVTLSTDAVRATALNV